MINTTNLHTLIRLLSGMHPSMLLIRPAGRKSFRTQIACIWLLSSVRSHVHYEKRLSLKFFTAVRAWKRLLLFDLPGVRAQMITQIVLSAEAFVAYLTFKLVARCAIASRLHYMTI